MKNTDCNIIVTIKPWNINLFKKKIKRLKGKWIIISKPSELTLKKLKRYNINNIFFVHWSKIVSSRIYKKYNCISFHMTDLPYGRGGSPLQNLIVRNKKATKISAFIMNNKLDSGDLISIKKKTLPLDGSAQQIYERSSKIIFEMIKEIINMKKIISFKQKGRVTKFKRLSNNSEINTNIRQLDKIYDHIRMLDAKTYKNAFIKKEKLKITFSNVKKMKNKLKTNITISLNDK